MTGRAQRETPSFPAGHLRHGAQPSSPYRTAHRVAAACDGRDGQMTTGSIANYGQRWALTCSGGHNDDPSRPVLARRVDERCPVLVAPTSTAPHTTHAVTFRLWRQPSQTDPGTPSVDLKGSGLS
jgi:hypothetical protein